MKDIENTTMAIELISHIGTERMDLLQAAMTRYALTDPVASALDTVMGIVKGHVIEDLPTTADAIAEIASSKKATRALLAGKMPLDRVLLAHRTRAQQAEVVLEKDRIREAGVNGTELVTVDEETELHIVQLTLRPHVLYEGMVLQHCLRNPFHAESYLQKTDSRIYSIRHEGILPLATVEVNPRIGIIPQARIKGDARMHVMSPEFKVLFGNLDTLANHCGAEVSHLTITDKVRSS